MPLPKNPDVGKQSTATGNTGMFERLFSLSQRQTTVRTEILAGITTFMTMACILAVNPTQCLRHESLIRVHGSSVPGASSATRFWHSAPAAKKNFRC